MTTTFPVPAHLGATYTAEKPDTLDLAARARLAIHGIGNTIDTELLTMYGLVHYTAPRPHQSHWASAETLVDPKLAESLSLLRLMCGSTEHQELEGRYFASILSRLEDGLYWDRYSPDRPWRNAYSPSFYGPGRDEDFSTMPGAGRMLRTMLVWRTLGADPERMEAETAALTKGLLRIAVRKDGYCYYPEKGGWGEPCAYPRSGWLNTDEALGETEGGEGSVVCMQGHQIYGAAQWYALSGDPVAFELAEKLTRYVTLPRFWGGSADPIHRSEGIPMHVAQRLPDPAYTAGHEQGHWYSHFHARAIALRGIFEFARVAGDERLAEFIRRSFEFTLSQGMPRSGWINCYPGGLNHVEGCALGDLVALGIRLSDEGVGDYWDDVEAVVRNQLVEQQLTNADHLERVAAHARHQCCQHVHPRQTAFDEELIAKTLGIYAGTALPESIPNPWVMHCCTSNATQGLYYAWEATLREHGATAEINFFLNRCGRLLDVDSFLPYEGRVHLVNKLAKRAVVRIPTWVQRRELHLSVDGQPRELEWAGTRLVVDDLQPTSQVELTFPVPTRQFSYTVNAHSPQERVYTLTTRGSTVVAISPRDLSPLSYPLYEREHLKGSTAPLISAERFVPDKMVLDW